MHTLVGGVVANNGLSASLGLFSMAGMSIILTELLLILDLGFGICAAAVIALKVLDSDVDRVHQSIWDGIFNPQ